MKLRIDPDTKDALTFLVGLFGIIAQGILVAFGVPPSTPMLGTFGLMIGLGVVRPVITGSRNEGKGDDDAGRSGESKRG